MRAEPDTVMVYNINTHRLIIVKLLIVEKINWNHSIPLYEILWLKSVPWKPNAEKSILVTQLNPRWILNVGKIKTEDAKFDSKVEYWNVSLWLWKKRACLE